MVRSVVFKFSHELDEADDLPLLYQKLYQHCPPLFAFQFHEFLKNIRYSTQLDLAPNDSTEPDIPREFSRLTFTMPIYRPGFCVEHFKLHKEMKPPSQRIKILFFLESVVLFCKFFVLLSKLCKFLSEP
ncbi:hypothetical protein K0M31_014681 [Melipona bicolor]|uniref:Uncharacterized protein n=1 Tax=Melipona bicolor TaxID=60889 RepID=A0AA40FH92_9HYME|nr:hypothetical protein K0M31_014681 [Melipona bicolor]